MNTTMTTTLPTEDKTQFVMLNEYDGKLWANTYRNLDGKLEVFGLVVADEWTEVDDFKYHTEDVNILGYVVEA